MPEPVVCNLCGEERDFHVLENEDFPYQVLKCGRCSLVFVSPHPNANTLADHYDKPYYDDWTKDQAHARARMWEKRLDHVELFQTRGRILDVGCGEGSFLRAALRRGWRIDGTELSPYAARAVSDLLGVKIFCGELYHAPYPMHSFDAITVWHVLEHVRDPLAYLLKIKNLLKPGGLLILAVPNVHNIVMQISYRIVRGHKLKLFSPEDRELHLYHFSPKTINSYLEKTGFGLLNLSPDYGIVDGLKKLLNILAVVPYYLTGIKIFDAMEVWATSKFSNKP